MKALIMAACISFISCASPKSKTHDTAGLPSCIEALIKNNKTGNKDLPRSITRYFYQKQTVFYVLESCCDKFNKVYKINCECLGAPDGGITGKGDGKLPGFFKEAINAKVIWENK